MLSKIRSKNCIFLFFLLDEQLNFIDVLNFYQPASRLKPILYYIQGDIYKKKSFADFMQEWNVPPKKKTK